MWSPTQTPVSPHRKLPGFPAIDHRGLSLFLCGGLDSSVVRRVIREYPEPFPFGSGWGWVPFVHGKRARVPSVACSAMGLRACLSDFGPGNGGGLGGAR